MKLGIVIVTYNSQKDIARLLDSIIIQKMNDLIIYIVDNNSNDKTLNIIQDYESHLSISIISSKTNNGFARGNNIGIQKAIAEGCDYVFILNPDMQLQEECLNILIDRMDNDKSIGVIGPIVLFGNNPENVIQVYGVKAKFNTQKKVDRFSGKKLTDEIPSENYVDLVLGGSMMIRSEVLKVTGFFEEDYFMYNDEIDLAYRIKKAGFKSLCLRDAVVKHFHDFAAGNKRGNNLMYYYIMRNRYLYFKKHRLYFNLVSSLAVEFISFPLKISWSIRRMWNFRLLKYYYLGLVDGLLGKKGIADKTFSDMDKTKVIILTADYEIFLGDITGTIKDCMIDPIQKLASILKKNDSKLTIFWDILHYYRLLELEKTFPELLQRRQMIEDQVLNLVKSGHDIQLHIHPHWMDARFENDKWKFVYDRFKLHNLSSEPDQNDINTILGCVTISKKLMEDTIRKVKPDYKVTTFRAGGYLIEPFEKLKEAFLANDIKIDSSVCPEIFNTRMISSYDFRNYPDKIKYNFESTPRVISEQGKFTEIPITTIRLPVVKNILYKIIRRIKYPHLEKGRKGIGLGAHYEDVTTSETKKLVHNLLSPQSTQLTTDSNFRERFNYLFKKTPSYSTMILHSKLLNDHTLKIIDDYVNGNKVRFISIQDYVNN